MADTGLECSALAESGGITPYASDNCPLQEIFFSSSWTTEPLLLSVGSCDFNPEHMCHLLQTPSTSRKSLDAPSWPGVYRLSISLMEQLLKTLRYNFLTEALDFVGVHQEQTLQVRAVCLTEGDT